MSDDIITVQYRDILDFPGYRAGDDGTIWSAWRQMPLPGKKGTKPYISDRWKQLKTWPHRYGYPMVLLRRDKKSFRFAVHALILTTFVGPCPEGMECCHEDDDGTNAKLTNLRWKTHKQNMQDAASRKRIPMGAKHHSTKLTAALVDEIRRRIANGDKKIDISKELNISRNLIWRVDKRTSWMDTSSSQ